MSFSDLRGASVRHAGPLATLMDNTILPDGGIQGLSLAAGEQLTVTDYPHTDEERDIPVLVRNSMAMDREATLTLSLKWDEDDPWAPISFQTGTPVLLNGRLDLSFGTSGIPDMGEDWPNGITFELFDWQGAFVNGQFTEIVIPENTVWDLSRLYTTGDVTLVPEPTSAAAIAWLLLLLGFRHERFLPGRYSRERSWRQERQES